MDCRLPDRASGCFEQLTMKITDRRLRKLEDRLGTGSRKPRLVLVLCRAGGRLALDIDTCIQIFDECGFCPMIQLAW